MHTPENDTPDSTRSSARAVARTNLFGLDREAMSAFFRGHGESAFRAKQVMQWIYARGVTQFDQMTDLSKKTARASARNRHDPAAHTYP